MSKEILGRIHSFESLGTVDGPGVRAVVFSQGCPLRCGCCHNPDTWDFDGGTLYTPTMLCEKIKRYKNYFGTSGGVTISGGEPLLQAEFFTETFKILKADNIHTCLDTSGYILNDNVKKLLSCTDLVLLDVKYTNEELYEKHVGTSYKNVLQFLEYLNQNNIKTILRQVVIKGLNDSTENAIALKKLKEKYPAVIKIELLPFKKLCTVKYENLNIKFPFIDKEVPDLETLKKLELLIK